MTAAGGLMTTTGTEMPRCLICNLTTSFGFKDRAFITAGVLKYPTTTTEPSKVSLRLFNADDETPAARSA